MYNTKNHLFELIHSFDVFSSSLFIFAICLTKWNLLSILSIFNLVLLLYLILLYFTLISGVTVVPCKNVSPTRIFSHRRNRLLLLLVPETKPKVILIFNWNLLICKLVLTFTAGVNNFTIRIWRPWSYVDKSSRRFAAICGWHLLEWSFRHSSTGRPLGTTASATLESDSFFLPPCHSFEECWMDHSWRWRPQMAAKRRELLST